MDVAQVVTNIILALAAVVSLIYTHFQVRNTSKQNAVAQQQAAKAQELAVKALRSQHRPLLIPNGTKIPLSTVDQPDWGITTIDITLSNVGPGVATNIQGRLFGSIDHIGTVGHAARYRFTFPEPLFNTVPIQCQARTTTLAFFPETDKIDIYSLAAPPNLSARLTLTYHDIFNQKHASIFDYTFDGRWKSVAFPEIEQDLEELDNAQFNKALQAQHK